MSSLPERENFVGFIQSKIKKRNKQNLNYIKYLYIKKTRNNNSIQENIFYFNMIMKKVTIPNINKTYLKV